MVLTTRNLLVYPYSDYQTELHDIIQNLHDEGLGYRKIAQWLNENEYQTPRGKKFFNSHVYSILKKKRSRDKRLNQKVEVEYGDFSLEFIERKLINSIWGIPKLLIQPRYPRIQFIFAYPHFEASRLSK